MSIVIGYNMSRPLPQSSSDGSKFGGSAAQTSLTSTYTGPAGPAGADGGVGPQGPAGSDGADGADGLGVPSGGTTDQLLKKVDGTDNNTTWFTPAWAASSHSHTASEVSDFDTEVANNSAVTDNTAKVSNVTTDLSASADGTSLTVASSDGTDASIPAATTSAWGAMTDEDKTKLDGIETGATADQTGAEIKTAYEAESDTNAFTDADHSKLDGIEANATADQTGAEIKTAYEAESDTNAFTDADHTKLDGLEQSDWNSSSGGSQILNKPTIPSNLSDLSDVDTTSPSTGQVLKWDGSSWGPDTDSTGGGGGGGGTTNLSASADGTSLTVASSSGDDASIPAATTSAWGAMTDEDKSKLDGITGTNTGDEVAATESTAGIVELATTTEATTGTDTARAVTPAGVKAALDDLIDGAPAALDTLNELAAAIDDDASYASTVTTALGLKAPLASPTFTGTVAIPNISDLESAVTANTAKVSNVTTNLSASADGTSLTVASSDGTDASIPAATTTAWGAMTDEDKTKLDGIESSADVTDTANVTAAGALMDSELTDLAGVKGVTISTLQPKPSEGAFADGDKTKLDGIEASADVTDTANVTAAGALMDSELTDLAGVKGVTISTLQEKPSEGAFADGDKTKLDGVEAGADVTDTANVTAAGALMDSELTDLAGVKGVTISTLQPKPSEGAFADGDKTKLDGIEAGADVTDTANVTAAGALMDSEVDADIKTLSLPASTTISDFGKTLVDDADAAAARTTLGVDASGTDNSTNVTLAGTPDYLTISGQEITRNQIDLANDVTGSLPDSSISSAATWNAKAAGDHDHDTAYVQLSTSEGGDGTAARIPSGANGDRPTSSVAGMFRWSTTDTRFEGYDGSDWGEIGGGNTTSNGLYEHAHTISANYTIGTNNNAISAGPVSVNSGVSVTVPSGSTWVVA